MQEETNKDYYPDFSTEVEPPKDFLRDAYIPPEGITSIQEYIDLNDGRFQFGNFFQVVRYSHEILNKIGTIAPEIIVDIEALKQNPHCMQCFMSITNKINGMYIEDHQAREAINEIICNDAILLAAIRELNRITKRQNWISETVHHIPKKVGAWREFLLFLKNEKIMFSNINVVDPGPAHSVLHIYIVPRSKTFDLISGSPH